MKPVLHPDHVVKATYPDVANVSDTDIYTFMFERESIENYPSLPSSKWIAFIDGPSGSQLFFTELKANVNSHEFCEPGRNQRIWCRLPLFTKPCRLPCVLHWLKISYPTLIGAILRLGAIPTCANSVCTQWELVYQISISGAKFVIVHSSSLGIALKTAKTSNISPENVLVIADSVAGINNLMARGKSRPTIQRNFFRPGEI